MRIIAGEFRGRKLLPPAGQATRPITDRVKQSLFDILTPHLPGARVYDCFAGTGSLGLESLSRGASHATFFETDRSAVQRLRQNIAALGAAERSTVISTDIFRYFAGQSTGAGPSVDVIFLDPPYRYLREKPAPLQQLIADLRARLSPDGLIIFRHDAEDRLELPAMKCVDAREYGGMALEFLTPA